MMTQSVGSASASVTSGSEERKGDVEKEALSAIVAVNQPAVIGQFYNFNTQLAKLRQSTSKENLQLIVKDPHNYGINKSGLSYAIIKANHNGTAEKDLIREILRKDLDNSLEESDNEGDNTLHWCAKLNYPNLARELTDKGFSSQMSERNSIGLTPNQVATVFAHNEFITMQLRAVPEFSDITFHCTDAAGKPIVDFKLNELHLAILCCNFGLIRDIFECFKKNKAYIDSSIKGIGNVLHLLVYLAHSQKKASEPLEIFQLLLQQPANKSIVALLTETENNWEDCSPLMLCAKYGEVGLLSQYMNYLNANVELAGGLMQVQNAYYTAVANGRAQVIEVLHKFYHFKPSLEHSAFHKMGSLVEARKAEPGVKRALDMMNAEARKMGYGRYQPAEPQSQSYENLVLQGGGGKGFAFPYALKAIRDYCDKRSQESHNPNEQRNLAFNRLVRVAGTSVGAIFALGLALGYSPEEMEGYLDYDFEEFLEDDHIKRIAKELDKGGAHTNKLLNDALAALNLQLQKVQAAYQHVSSSHYPTLASIYEFAFNGRAISKEVRELIARIIELNEKFTGFTPGKKALAFLKDLITKKGFREDLTFGELAEFIKQDQAKEPENRKHLKHLHVVVTNLTQENFEVLSSEKAIYSNYVILDAVRASMSYPLIFSPHHLRIKEGRGYKSLGDEYIDGGVLRNYAVDEFDWKRYTENDWPGDPYYPELNKQTLGIRFRAQSPQDAAVSRPDETFVSRLKAFVNLFMQAEDLISQYKNTEYYRSVELRVEPDFTTFTFKKLTADDKRLLKERCDIAISRYFAGEQALAESPRAGFAAAAGPAITFLHDRQRAALEGKSQADAAELVEAEEALAGAGVDVANDNFKGRLNLENVDETGTSARTNAQGISVAGDTVLKNINKAGRASARPK